MGDFFEADHFGARPLAPDQDVLWIDGGGGPMAPGGSPAGVYVRMQMERCRSAPARLPALVFRAAAAADSKLSGARARLGDALYNERVNYAAPRNRRRLAVEAARVRPLLDMAVNAGVDLGPLLRAAGLPEGLAAGSGGEPVALASYFRLQQAVSRALGDETFQMSERQLLPGTTDFVLSRLAGSASLDEAMRSLATYYNLLHGGEYNRVVKRGGLISFRTDDRSFPFTIDDRDYLCFAMECVQIYLHSMLAIISEETADAALRRVSVVRPRGGAEQPQLNFWRAPIQYGCETYALDYDAEIMARKVEMPAPELLTAGRVYEEAISLIERRERAAPRPVSVAARLRELFARGVIDQPRAAILLGMSVATLRRRLAEEGSSFRDLRRDALNETAKDMLAARRPIADVAERLGFSDFRSFTRAFSDWNGLTPKAFQAQRRRDRSERN